MVRSRHLVLLFAAMLLVFAPMISGCARSTWRPPPPRGRTWMYQSQAAYVRSSSGGGGLFGRLGYFYMFSSAGSTGVPRGQQPDSFWRSQTAGDRRLFNAHLATRGERLEWGADGPLVNPLRRLIPPGRGGERPTAPTGAPR